MSTAIDLNGSAPGVSKIEPLFDAIAGFGGYDVTADGQKILALLPPAGEAIEPLTVVQNWTAALKK